MRIRGGVICEECGVKYKGIKIYKGKFLCYTCYSRKIIVCNVTNRKVIEKRLKELKKLEEDRISEKMRIKTDKSENTEI